jgi:hypothetical protein
MKTIVDIVNMIGELDKTDKLLVDSIKKLIINQDELTKKVTDLENKIKYPRAAGARQVGL